MTISKYFRYSCFFVAAFIISALPISQAHAAKVEQILISGQQRIAQSTIASYMNLKIGAELNSTATDHALKSLFSTGLFADVKVESNGNTVSVVVVENPVVNEIVFEGNDAISDEELISEIQMRPRQVFTRTKVQSDVTRLNQIYGRQGKFSATVQPKIIKLDQNRVNLVFEINEGDVTKIKSIRFVGNKKYSDSKLRSIVSSKQSSWFRFLSSSDRYDEDRVSFDQELLRSFYLSQGYADFQILSSVAELSNDKDRFYITFTIDEGSRYKVLGSKITSEIRDFNAEVLNKSVTYDNGDWYDADEIKKTVKKMTDKMGDLQYAFVDIRPDIQRDRDVKTVTILYDIKETPRVFVERVNVNGNIRTLDKVLRREMELVEGDPFNRSKLAKSERNIRNLNFFENVDVKVSQGSAPDKTIVDINVQEKSTGELSLGAGFSTNDGPLADFKIRERNLLGKGQDLLLGATIAGQKTEFDLSFTEPYFLDRDISAGVDLFHSTRDLQDESSFDQQRTGGGVRIGYPLSENWRQTLRYRIESNEITDIDPSASLFIKNQEGKRTTSALSQRLFYDTRDSSVFTTSGMTYWLDTEVAGLGGDAQYASAKTGASFFRPLSEQIILNVLGEAGVVQGYGGEDVKINERYFLGGNTLRGFERSGVGPRDTATKDALGGNYFYRGSVEMSFPIGLPKELGIKAHTFSDFGSLWDLDETGAGIQEGNALRATAGVGLSWRSPFGPIRVDFALPYLDEEFDEEENFRFDFGTRF